MAGDRPTPNADDPPRSPRSREALVTKFLSDLREDAERDASAEEREADERDARDERDP